MKRVVRSSFVSIFSLRAYSLVYLTLAVSAFSSAEIDKHGASKTTKVGLDTIENSKKSALSPHQRGNSKAKAVEAGRNHSGSAMIGDEGNSAALNRFLEDVLRAQDDLKRMDQAARHVNRGPRLDDSHTDQHSAVSVNTEDVLGRTDIGYVSRLRGKRTLDRNYEAMWMLQKKKYGGESARDVPQRVYLDNEMTFKRNAEGADFHAPYRSLGMLDRAVYERGVMADQPLKDWTRKRDLHSSGDWSNSNENLEVTNGKDLWLRDYKPARESLVNSDSNTEEGNLRHVDSWNQPEIVSLYNPMYADDLIALQESPVAISNEKSEAKSSILDSLKKTVLKLRNSLMLSNKKKEDVISKGQPSWWDDSRSIAETFDSGRHNLDNNLNKDAIWRIKRAENTENKDKSSSRIFHGAEFEERNLKVSHDRNKRSRRSFADLNYTNDQQDIFESQDYRKAQIIKDALGNTTRMLKPERVIVKPYSNDVNDNERNFANALNKTNIFKPRYSSEKEFFLHDHYINLTIIPSVSNKTNISGLRYFSSAEFYPNGRSVDNKSLLRINNDLHTYPPKRSTENQIPVTSPKAISQLSATETLPKSVGRITGDHANSLDSEENSLAWSTSADPLRLSAYDGVDEGSRRRSKDRSGAEKLEVAARKIPRFGADDGQSRGEKGAGLKLPRGNTSRGFGAVANESRCRVVGTTVIVAERGVPGMNDSRKESREPIPGVIKVFEPRGRSYQKQGVEVTVRLSRLMGEQEEETFTGGMKMSTSDVYIGESRNANGKDSSSPSAIDSVAVATARPEAASAITARDRRVDFARMIVDNDSRGQQQMVPSLSGGNRSANKSNGNSDTDGIDIRALGSNGNETMNVEEAARPVAWPRERGHESGNNLLRRKLLWISTISADTNTDDSMTESAKSIPNTRGTARRHFENVINNDGGKNKTIIVASSDFSKTSSVLRTRIKREDNAARSSVLQNALKSQDSDVNHHTRCKRSIYSSENLARNNAADPENAAIAKEAAINHDETQENDEEYLNQSAEEVKGDCDDREEDMIEENDKAVQDERKESSSSRKFDPIKARVNMLIKQRLDKKNRNKDSDSYRRRKRDTLNMIEYYDYDSDEEQKRDAPVNEQEIEIKNDEFLNKDNAKIKRDGKRKSCKTRELGKKKNENKEAVLKAEREKKQRKNKEPKEQIIVDLGERKNKTVKDDLDQSDKKPSGSSSFESVFKEREQISTKDKLHQNEDAVNDVIPDLGNVKTKWSDKSLENGMALSKNSESMSENDNREKIISDKTNARVDVNPDIIEHMLNIGPIKILESSTELETFKNLHEDLEDKRSDGKSEDRYYYQESDWKHPNDVESLYEELKNVYDWSDGELKNGLRLRGDQRLRYESDDKIDTNSSQLQSLDDRFSSSQNDGAQRRYHSSDASWKTMSSMSTPASDYFALKVMNDMLKGGLEQNNSAEEILPNAVSSITVQSGIPQAHIAEKKKNPSLQENTIQRSATNTNSGSPYENREYIESKMREMLKRNLNSRNQAVISSQDLHESFVESLDWHDDFDDNVKVRFGRGLKAVNDVVILDANKTHDQVNGSDIVNEISVNSYLHDSPQTFRENSSISRRARLVDQGCYDNATANLMDIFNIRDTNNDEDLEVAEQKYINRRMPRVRRAVAPYRVFYDDMSQNQRDFDEADESLSSHSQLPNILENQPDGTYGERDSNWSNNMRDLNRYPRIPQNSRKKKKSRKKDKKNKHTTEKHRKSGSRDSSGGDRRHHAHRSDVSRIASGDEWKKSKKKNKARSKSALTGRGSIQKTKTAERELLRVAAVNEAPGGRVLYENAEDRSTVKPEENDARRKEITLLLAADNVDDESQTDMALHGELAGKIVEQIFERVQKNDQLKSIFGPGLQKNYKTEQVMVATNIYRQGLDETGTNHSETMMKRVMELLGRLILNEVQRKTCVSLSPDMREFLGWMLGVDQEEELLEEAPPLPLVREEITLDQKSGQKFLFDNTFGQAEKENINDLQKKVRIIETLVEEYNALTAKEKTEVQTVYDYLIRQLNQLLQYIEARETTEMKGKLASMSTGAARVGIESILQYQNAMPNAINATNSVMKNASFLPIDMHNLFRSNNTSLKMTDRQLYYSHVAPRHREARSLDKVSLKQHRKTKRQETHNRGRNKNHRKSMQKCRKHQDHAGSSHRKSRRKRADLEKNDGDSLYLGYEAPTIYDSFKLLDAKLTGKKRKRKRELADKGSVAVENDRTLDSLPIKGRNRLEDEVILLNKREAWKRENEEQLEEVAFGKDMRNNTRRERKRFEKLTGEDKRKPIDEISSRAKREDAIRETLTIRSVDRSNNFHGPSEIGNGESGKNSTSKEDNVVSREDRLRLVERRINVFVDNNKTDAAIDTVVTEVTAGGKLAINAAADNQVKGKLHAINCETKIDKTNRSASFVNLTSGTEPRVSKERQKVPEAEREADDNAVKLNRATNHRSEEMDPEVELKNLRQRREKGIYSVADWKTNDLFYGDDNLPRNKLRGKYVANLDEPDDLDTGAENNLAILRLKSKKRPNDVVEWKLVPLIRRSPYRDAGASSRIYLIEKRLPALSNNRSVKIDLYSNSPELWRLKHRRRRNGAFNISPVLRTIDDEDSFSLGIPPETKRVIEIAGLKDLRVDPKTLLKRSRKLSRLRNNKRWNDGRVAEFRVPSAWKDLNRKLRNLPRSRNDPELGDRAIYDDAVGLRLPVWPYRYYDDFTGSSTTFHFVPTLGPERAGDTYRYPARDYLQYGPFKERARDSRVARRDGFRLMGSWEEAADFPADNLANKSSKCGSAREKFSVETGESARANHGDYRASVEAKYTSGKIEENNTTRARLEK